MTCPSQSNASCAMDPFLHPFALEGIEAQRSNADGKSLLKDGLRSLRKLYRSRLSELKGNKKEKEKETVTANALITTASDLSPQRRSSFHFNRDLGKTPHTHGRKLSCIPETDQDEEPGILPPLLVKQPLQASLLGLAPELRNLIYNYVFSDWRDTGSLNLLRTCRQVYKENLAFSQTLFKIHTEHWPDQDYFQARYTSRLSRPRLNSIRNLALRLPRGAPYDCYNSRYLHVNLAALGFKLTTLVIFSHYPRPLPRTNDYGGVLEMNFCHWIKETLYSMPTLRSVHIVNYEGAAPRLFDIPSPRLVRLLRDNIFKDVMIEQQSLSEEDFQWQSLKSTPEDRAYRVFSAKLSRSVDIIFRRGTQLAEYGLGHVYEMQSQLNPDELLNDIHPDVPRGPYAHLLAEKNSTYSARRRLSKSQWGRRLHQQNNVGGGVNSGSPLSPTGSDSEDSPKPPYPVTRKRLSKRRSLPAENTAPLSNRGHLQEQRRSWQALKRSTV